MELLKNPLQAEVFKPGKTCPFTKTKTKKKELNKTENKIKRP
jgi:hypothetical protein